MNLGKILLIEAEAQILFSQINILSSAGLLGLAPLIEGLCYQQILFTLDHPPLNQRVKKVAISIQGSLEEENSTSTMRIFEPIKAIHDFISQTSQPASKSMSNLN